MEEPQVTQVHTHTGAAIAAVLFLSTNLLTVYTMPGITSVTQMGEATLVTLFLGALIHYFKDLKALDLRKYMAGIGNGK